MSAATRVSIRGSGGLHLIVQTPGHMSADAVDFALEVFKPLDTAYEPDKLVIVAQAVEVPPDDPGVVGAAHEPPPKDPPAGAPAPGVSGLGGTTNHHREVPGDTGVGRGA